MLISGNIGITILENNNKIIILLADDHSNTKYWGYKAVEGRQTILNTWGTKNGETEIPCWARID